MSDRPLDNIIRDGGMMNIFRSIGCIGDSLASGEFEHNDHGERNFWDCYEYSWGKQIERITGIEMTNFSRGGLTAYQLYKEADEKTSPIADINRLFDADNAKQAYIIALGVNDITGPNVLRDLYGGKLGAVNTDVNREDYRLNAPTYIGTYAKLIQRLQTIQPHAKFFLMTMPDDNGTPEAAHVIDRLALLLPNCYVLDFYHYTPPYDFAFRRNFFGSGHMNAMGYLLTAHYIMTYIDWIIRHNPQEFRNVQFIGSGKYPADDLPPRIM